MKRIAVLSTLLVAALVGSYLTWAEARFGGPKAEGEVVLFRGGAEDLTAITWTSAALDLTLERKIDGLGPYTWVTAQQKGDLPQTPEGDEIERKTSFRGNVRADELWAEFSPLRGERSLGPAEGLKLDALGLLPPQATLRLQRAAGPLELAVGGGTFGDAARYVALNGEVFLVADAALRPLERGHQLLIERRLSPLKEEDLTGLTVKRGEASLHLVREGGAPGQPARWLRDGSPDDIAATWAEKLARLRVQRYLPEDPIGVTPPVVEITLEGGEKPWTIEIYPGATAGLWYARASFSRAPVQLTRSLAEEVVADLDALLPAE